MYFLSKTHDKEFVSVGNSFLILNPTSIYSKMAKVELLSFLKAKASQINALCFQESFPALLMRVCLAWFWKESLSNLKQPFEVFSSKHLKTTTYRITNHIRLGIPSQEK